ncbi:hypothetical protein [Luteibacter yeojuensis]|uniref:Uncharacterized protein n=1 Tax=Luteibacter yeojuensis TaxID=345309 RepID=A0A7X5QV26_9GAMM|nr:hypothetical protein [Luteibacter yeojuensis]NID15938.1 hypothetical protein [Luteibacter yeojuensis]
MKYVLTAITYTLMALSALMFLKSLDRAVEIDDLKSHIEQQNRAIAFLQSINVEAMTPCTMKINAFDRLAKASGYASTTWTNEHVFVGPFQVKRRGDCISSMKLIGLPGHPGRGN